MSPTFTPTTRDNIGPIALLTVGAATQRFRYCPPGTFLMGSPIDEPGRFADEGPQHRVRLTEGFWLADTPVTQALWTAAGRKNPSHFVHDQRPVEQVTWHEAVAFCAALGCLLPTEAQWEYACRAGSPIAAPVADRALDRNDGSSQSTYIVATRRANAWGLYDMLGNVYEWCRDRQRPYTPTPVDDPCDERSGARVVRGGSWESDAGLLRAACRLSVHPGNAGDVLGFRLLRASPIPPG